MFGKLMKARRKKLGLTLRDLGRKVDLSAAFLSDVEHGNRKPSLKTEVRIAKALGLTTVTCPECGRPMEV